MLFKVESFLLVIHDLKKQRLFSITLQNGKTIRKHDVERATKPQINFYSGYINCINRAEWMLSLDFCVNWHFCLNVFNSATFAPKLSQCCPLWVERSLMLLSFSIGYSLVGPHTESGVPFFSFTHVWFICNVFLLNKCIFEMSNCEKETQLQKWQSR